MPLPHSPRAPLNVTKPEPTGVCDRCEFLYPLNKLVWQWQWAGQSITNLNLRVCPRCLDALQENGFRTIVIGPDPKPLKDPRPYRWPTQAPTVGQFALDDGDDLLDTGNTLGPT